VNPTIRSHIVPYIESVAVRLHSPLRAASSLAGNSDPTRPLSMRCMRVGVGKENEHASQLTMVSGKSIVHGPCTAGVLAALNNDFHLLLYLILNILAVKSRL